VDNHSALQAANQALTGRGTKRDAKLASSELRDVDAKTGAWEMAAMVSVALAAILAVIALWFL
jgi:hypothetical protein